MGIFEIERVVHAPTEVVWPIISDVEAYANVAPNLSKAEIVSGSETEMVRRCWDTRGGTWLEQCTLWHEGHAYRMEVDTSDYPYPLKIMMGTWSVEPQGAGSLIKMRFDYELIGGAVGRLFEKAFLPAFRRICTELLDNWQVQIEAREPTIV